MRDAEVSRRYWAWCERQERRAALNRRIKMTVVLVAAAVIWKLLTKGI